MRTRSILSDTFPIQRAYTGGGGGGGGEREREREKETHHADIFILIESPEVDTNKQPSPNYARAHLLYGCLMYILMGKIPEKSKKCKNVFFTNGCNHTSILWAKVNGESVSEICLIKIECFQDIWHFVRPPCFDNAKNYKHNKMTCPHHSPLPPFCFISCLFPSNNLVQSINQSINKGRK